MTAIASPDLDAHDFRSDIAAIARIEAVPTILDVICKIDGMGFAAVVRVTPGRWIACEVQDDIAFGLQPGSELDVATTLAREILQSRAPVVIGHVAEDPVYRNHPALALHGLESYIALPIILKNGSFFGTLCAVDTRPAAINNSYIISMFRLFADLIADHLWSNRQLQTARDALDEEREEARLREQFIAVLGHDLRNPVAAFQSGIRMLGEQALDERGGRILELLEGSVNRMDAMISGILDFARFRLGGGIALERDADTALEETIGHVVEEMRAAHPTRAISVSLERCPSLSIDHNRMAQLFSNLLGNAIAHGDPAQPIRIVSQSDGMALTVEIANGGVPIPPDALPHLFEPFYRPGGDGSAREGLGLGLYIASEIARAHGGTLSARSDEQETCFTLVLPLETEAQ